VQKLIEYLGLPESADTPFFFIHDHPIRTKYLKTGVKIVDLPEFLREFQEGALPPYVKSEEPLLEQEGPVTVVTGSTYKQLVLNSTKATAMYFFAPW